MQGSMILGYSLEAIKGETVPSLPDRLSSGTVSCATDDEPNSPTGTCMSTTKSPSRRLNLGSGLRAPRGALLGETARWTHKAWLGARPTMIKAHDDVPLDVSCSERLPATPLWFSRTRSYATPSTLKTVSES
jgi:hypothetical protein